MADVKCPSCGKANPAELEICQFCGTLLRQTRTEPLAPILPGQFPEKKATSELERTLPGWLRDARRAGNEPVTSPIPQAKVPQEPPPAAPPPPSSKVPQSPLDLLAGLSQAGEEEEDIPEWLKSLQGETPAPAAPAPAASVESQEIPSWLTEIQQKPAQTEEPAPQPEAWGFSSEAATFNFNETEEPAQSFGDTPDWLAALEAQETASQPPQPPAQEFPPASSGADSGDTPDWLASLTSIGAAQPQNAPVEPAQPEGTETPDWLSSLSELEPPAQPQTESAPATDLPDWLADLQSPAPTPLATSPEPTSAESAAGMEIASADLPDWLSSLQETAPANMPSMEIAAAELPADALPDWMSSLQETASTEKAEETVLPAEISSSDLPDWLTSTTGESPAQPAPPPETSANRPYKPFPTGALNELRSLAESEPVPDFLSGLVSDAGQKKSEPATEAETGALPDWLTDVTAGAVASVQTESVPPAAPEIPPKTQPGDFSFPEFEAESLSPASSSAGSQTLPPMQEGVDSLLLDVPDWLSGFTPEAEAKQPAESVASQDADLQPVELPSWVQAMRPVESMLTGTAPVDTSDEEVERQGPLAGLRSVLPIPANALEIRKPKPYALKLQTDENQRGQAALLEQLLASENAAKSAPHPPKVSLLRPLRWALFGILTLSVLIPAILGTHILPAPELPTDANAPFNKFYDTLANFVPDGAPVLVVTDYQPGFAGEMEQAAVPVIAHLMRKNAQMAFLSTSPMSIEMGERLLQKGRAFYDKNGQQVPSYQLGQQYLFLGYLPGGAAGVKAFAEQPQRMTGIDSLNGDLWQTDMLRNKMSDISGFAAILVITDDPDNGRLWIEQTATRLGNTPMLMVTSAQAGPMIQPYSASGQLSGLVVGLEGGALYEKRDAQPGNLYPGHIKQLYWDGFGAALSVTLLAIFFGAVWSVVERLRSGKEVMEQDET